LFFSSFLIEILHRTKIINNKKEGAFGRTVVMHAVAPIRLLGALVG
jgi:hypothetical protein